MKILTIIWVVFIILYCLKNLWDSFHLSLAWQVWRKKRKFYWVKIKCFLWEDDGKYEFNNPEIFKEPYQIYLKNHPYEVEQLVEVLETQTNRYYFAAVDRVGERDYSFKNKARILFNTFHVDAGLVQEIKPLRFSWKQFMLTE